MNAGPTEYVYADARVDGVESQRTAPVVSIVVPTRNRGELIAETLRALLDIANPQLEIVVADQSTDDATQRAVEAVAGDDRRVRYHRTATVGSSAGRNVGATVACAPIVAYVDDDCVVSPGWLDALLAEFAAHDVAAVYGQLLPYEQEERTGTEVGFKDEQARQEFAGRVPPWYIGHGGNMAFRRADLLDVGGFDPLLSAGGLLRSNEDGDISYRLLAAGRRVAYNPAMLAYHKHWKNWEAQARMERNYGIGAGAQFAKYMRCGDGYGARLLAQWMWQLGVRRVGSGLLKWHSTRNMYLGYCQLVYPLVGIWRSWRCAINRRTMTYVAPAGADGLA